MMPQTLKIRATAFGTKNHVMIWSQAGERNGTVNGDFASITNFIWGIADDVLRDLYRVTAVLNQKARVLNLKRSTHAASPAARRDPSGFRPLERAVVPASRNSGR